LQVSDKDSQMDNYCS